MMEMVVKIPDDMIKSLEQGNFGAKYNIYDLVGYLMNGTPLPKGHGRLVDADALEKKMCDREEELGDDRALWESSAVSVALDMFAPTIIEGSDSE